MKRGRGPAEDTVESGAQSAPAFVSGIGAASHEIAIDHRISSRVAAAEGPVCRRRQRHLPALGHRIAVARMERADVRYRFVIDMASLNA